jgi:sirohydrochlorin cobaltochelatase
MAENINRLTGFRISTHEYTSWLGVECPDVRSAIWMMRGMIASNVLSRREDTVLFIPVDLCHDPNGEIGAENILRLYRFAKIRGIL